jgi:[ribosomal protein S5]-alanine N-acetyltransferase
MNHSTRFRLSQAIVRPFQPEDAPSITRQLQDPDISRYMSIIPYPYHLRDAEEWIAHSTAEDPITHFTIEVEGEAVGGIGLTLASPERGPVHQHTAEIGYWIGKPYWGRGIIAEAVSAVAAWGFEYLRLVRIFAYVFAPNRASARVLEKTGFVCEGNLHAAYHKHGQFYDGLVYAQVRLPEPAARG